MKKNIIISILILAVISAGFFFYSKNEKTNDAVLSQKELQNLYYLRDEEKMAFDVYQTLGDKWSVQAFQNISNSESRHQSKVVELLNKYGYEDMSKDLPLGKFYTKEIEAVYNQLVLEGDKNVLNALYVGATIEIFDFEDLNKKILETEKQDLKSVFQELKMGSENHLEAFKRQISRYENFDESKLIKLETENMITKKETFKNSLVVDVRTKEEYAEGNFPGSINIPLSEIEAGNIDIFKNTEKENIVLVCRSGNRAGQAQSILEKSGITKKITNLGPWENLKSLNLE